VIGVSFAADLMGGAQTGVVHRLIGVIETAHG
jgi:hypothetical protein